MDETYKSDEDILSEDEEDEEKYVSVAAITPGGNSFKSKSPTPGGPDVITPNGRNTHIEVDDITLDVERKYYALSRSVLVSRVDPYKISAEWDKLIGPNVDDTNIVEQSSEC